ncbi:MAG: chloride channel protein [Nitrososphaeria archaeon]
MSTVNWLILPFIPAIWAMFSGLLVYSRAPEAEGHGTDAVIESFHKKKGYIRGRVPIIKTIASVFTIGSGGSAGREGPIAQMGAGFGSWLASALNLSDHDRRIMLMSGAAAGIGSIFKAPLGGEPFLP